MRIRKMLTATLLGGGLVLGVASAVSAQTTTQPKPEAKTETTKAATTKAETTETKSGGPTETKIEVTSEPALAFDPHNLSFADREIFECFEKQSKSASPDFVTCSNAPSPILPASNEVLWSTLSFAILVAFFIWKGYPAMKKGMDGRSDRIRQDLARADEAKVEAEEVLARYQAQVAASKGEATRIIEDARATAEATKAELHKRAEAEIVEMRQRANADIEASKVQAVADLKGEVASLAIGAAEAIVHASLDQATQIQLVENYINTVGSQN